MRAVISAAFIALALKLALASVTVGTNDALTWEHDLVQLRTSGFARLYSDGVQYASPEGRLYPNQAFIHPPAMLTALVALGALQDTTGLPLRFWLRAACAFADFAMLFVVLRLTPITRNRRLLILLALCPVSILISGFHCNTDPIMMCFLVLGVLLIDRRKVALAGVTFGIATCIKLIPAIFAPAILFYLPNFRDRTRWSLIALATWIMLSMPWLAREPALILKTMIGYGSNAGLWGFYFMTSLLEAGGIGAPHRVYAPAAKWIALGAAAAIPIILRFMRLRPTLFTQCGLITSLFLFVAPGFGLQYLAWTVPWALALGLVPASIYYGAAGLLALMVYTNASGGLHVNAYADLFDPRPRGIFILLMLMFWVCLGSVAWKYGRIVSERAKAPDV